MAVPAPDTRVPGAAGTAAADSTQTLPCTYLSAVLLTGLVLNASLDWGWADPIAGLVIAALIVPRTLMLLRETVSLLLESTPPGLDLADVRAHPK